MRDALAILDEAEARLAPLSLATNLAWWESQVAATEENAERRTRAELALSDALADRELFAAVAAARSSGANGEAGRRLDLLHDLMLKHQAPGRSSREDRRARVLGRPALLAAPRACGRRRGRGHRDQAHPSPSDDPAERREAWEASKTVGAEVADDVRELARLRNEAARSLGHRDWFALSLSADELDEQKLIDTLADADRVTAEPFARWKGALDEKLAARFGCAVSELRPWHYADPFFQETPPDGAVDLDPLFDGQDVVALSRRTFEGIGFDVEGILARERSLPARRQEPARVLHRHRPRRRRAHPREHRRRRTTRPTRCSTSSATASTTSASATTCRGSCARRISSRPRHPRSSPARSPGGASGSSSSSARARPRSPSSGARLEAARAAELLVFTRWVLVMNAFERALYADPEADLDTLWWELVSRYQGIDAARRTPGARLGGEDPHRGLARLLPHLSLRSDRRRSS